ncbi:ABC transporter ATP-binding protein [Peribacillus asahii]|uniref:ABC transporter ATP-binding protein n=1 Tax=Peribacillus asahii TaxID=228899 RepID=UPI003815B9E6
MKDIVYFLKQIHSYAGNRLYINLLAMTCIGLLESAGILLLVPMISISGIVNMDVEVPKSLNIFAFLETIPDFIVLPMILGIYMIIVLAGNLLQRLIMIRNAKIQNGFLRKLRMETYNTLLRSNWAFFIKNRKSDLINILLTEITRTSVGTNAFLQFLASLIFTLVQIGLAFMLSPYITFFVLISGAFLVVLNRRFLKKSWTLGNRNYELGKSFLAGVTDQINGIKDIKSNSLEESRMEWFSFLTKQMETEQVEYTRLKMTSQFYYKFASTLLIAIFIFISVKIFHAQAGQLMLITIIFGRLWPRVAGIQSSLEQIFTTLPSFKAVKALQMECKEAQEFQKRDYNQTSELKEGIECRDVQFRYNKNESNYTLKDINLSIPANQMTAFVGRSGAGKSTLIDLLMGLNQPETGQILVDGMELTEGYILSLRSTLSYVPQDPFLFNASIRENLMLVKPDATEEEMWEALTFASAAIFVSKLQHGLDSLIGDRGIKLSGGERQRLVLARAILRKPSILVLDEATSALDTESESNIQTALEQLKGKMTIIVIAHRLSTIRNADQVIVLDEGKIIQQGGFNQLSKEKNKVFSKLLKKQMEVVQ